MIRASDLTRSEEGRQVAAKLWKELLQRFEMTEKEVLEI